jgi:xanthine dehydrogenase YagS FAD-binding subunit
MKEFKHISAKTVQAATKALRYYKRKGVINAGGTDLLGVLRDRILPDYPEAVIDIKTIASLDYITESAKIVNIGATTPLTEIADSEIINRVYPMLSKAAQAIATPQIRNMATIAGNLCQDVRCWYYRYPDHIGGRMICFRKGGKGCFAVMGDNRYHAILGGKKCFAVCPSDLAVALTALDAQVVIADHSRSKAVPIGAFYQKMGTTILGASEMVTEIRIPQALKGSRQCFTKFTLRKPGDFALASVALNITFDDSQICKDARVVLGAIAPIPVRALGSEEAIKDKAIDEQSVSDAAEAAVAGSRALSKNGYKIVIVKALVRKALFEINA